MTRALVVAVVVLAGCKDRPHAGASPAHGHALAPPDAPPDPPDAAPPPVPQPPTRPHHHIDDAPAEACAVHDVRLIYVVDDASRLWSFDPSKLPDDPFHEVGTLDCPSSTTPFSMAIDRTGIAWVVYSDGDVYRASIIDATCAPEPVSGFTDDGVDILFGMGFVAERPGSATERLFIATDDDARELAWLDTAKRPAPWMEVGTIKGRQSSHPELTGTADARLYGYFPEHGAGFVQEIDRKTAALRGKRFSLGGDLTGTINAWAFAFWGGAFYMFTTIDANSTVRRIDRKTGKTAVVLEHLDQRIVGAGVSTCAPLMERPAEVERVP